VPARLVLTAAEIRTRIGPNACEPYSRMLPSNRLANWRTMRVAVITPYYRELPEILQQCHASVAGQSHSCKHFLVADGHPDPQAGAWPVEHLVLSKPHGDSGNTPRAIGSLSAMNQGYDAIAYLDADNWYYRNHIEAMVEMHLRTGAWVCTGTRTIHRFDGSLMYADRYESDGKDMVDTSCLFITRAAFRVLPIWAMMPLELAPICDRIIWRAIQTRRYSCAHLPEPTVAFRTQYECHYQGLGEQPPPGTKSNAESTGKAFQWWNSLTAEQREDWERYFDFGSG
jgi:hypothetical protein